MAETQNWPDSYLKLFDSQALKQMSIYFSGTAEKAIIPTNLDSDVVTYLNTLVYTPELGDIAPTFSSTQEFPTLPELKGSSVTAKGAIQTGVAQLATVFYVHQVIASLESHRNTILPSPSLGEFLGAQELGPKLEGLAKMMLKYGDATRRWQPLDALIYYVVLMRQFTKNFSPSVLVQRWIQENFSGLDDETLEKFKNFYVVLSSGPQKLEADLQADKVRTAKNQDFAKRKVLPAYILQKVITTPETGYFEKVSGLYRAPFTPILDEVMHFETLAHSLEEIILDPAGGWKLPPIDKWKKEGFFRKPTPRADWVFTFPSDANPWVAAPAQPLADQTPLFDANEPALAALFQNVILDRLGKTRREIRSNTAYAVNGGSVFSYGTPVTYLFDLSPPGALSLLGLNKGITLDSLETVRPDSRPVPLQPVLSDIDSQPVPLLPILFMPIYTLDGKLTEDLASLAKIAQWQQLYGVTIYSSRYADLNFDNLRDRSDFEGLSRPDYEMTKELRKQLFNLYRSRWEDNPEDVKFATMFQPLSAGGATRQATAAVARSAHLQLEYFFWTGEVETEGAIVEENLRDLYETKAFHPRAWMTSVLFPKGIYNTDQATLVNALGRLNAEAVKFTHDDRRSLNSFIPASTRALQDPENLDELRAFFVSCALHPLLPRLAEKKVTEAFLADFVLAFLNFPIYPKELSDAMKHTAASQVWTKAEAQEIRSPEEEKEKAEIGPAYLRLYPGDKRPARSSDRQTKYDADLKVYEEAKAEYERLQLEALTLPPAGKKKDIGDAPAISKLIPTSLYPTSPVALHLYIATDKSNGQMVGWALWDTSSQDFTKAFGETFTSKNGEVVSTDKAAELIYLYTRLNATLDISEKKSLQGLGSALMVQGILDAKLINKKTVVLTEPANSMSVFPDRPPKSADPDLPTGVPRLYYPIKGNLIEFYKRFGFERAFPARHTILTGLIRLGAVADAWAAFESPEDDPFQIMEKNPLNKNESEDALQFYKKIANVFSVGGDDKGAIVREVNALQRLSTAQNPREEDIINNVSFYDVGDPSAQPPIRTMRLGDIAETDRTPWSYKFAQPRTWQRPMLILSDSDRSFTRTLPDAKLPYRPPRLQTRLDWRTAASLFKIQYLSRQISNAE